MNSANSQASADGQSPNLMKVVSSLDGALRAAYGFNSSIIVVTIAVVSDLAQSSGITIRTSLCVLVSTASFLLMIGLRPHLPVSFAKTLISVIIVAICGALLEYYLKILNTIPKDVVCALIALAASSSVAALIISFNLQRDYFGRRFPSEVMSAIRRNIADGAYFKRFVKYTFDISISEKSDDTIIIREEYKYSIENRTPFSRSDLPIGFSFNQRYGKILSCKINRKEISLDSEAKFSQTGLSFDEEIPPRGTVDVEIICVTEFEGQPRGQVTFSQRYPVCKFSFKALTGNGVKTDLQSEMHGNRHFERMRGSARGSEHSLEVNDGLLPYESITIRWEKISGGEQFGH